MKKIYVLDTSVILFDNNSIYNFDSDVIIPITVMNELDNFKKGNEDINYHAREFIKLTDSLPKEGLFNGGCEINEFTKLSIKLEQPFSKIVEANFEEKIPDHKIINCAYLLSLLGDEVIVVSNDANMRNKTRALGLDAQCYTSEEVKLYKHYTGIGIIEDVDDNTIDELYAKNYTIDENIDTKDFVQNQYFIFKNGSKSALSRYQTEGNSFKLIDKQKGYGITPKNSEQTFAMDALLDNSIQLVALTGKAGTGKTLLALAAAIERKKDFKQIYLARPIVPLSNRDMGFLPGSISEKLDPYMLPLFDNLDVIKNQFADTDSRYKKISEMQEKNKLIISPLAYIRGRSLNNVYFIVDEAQNLTPKEIKTIVTRAGEGTKFIFTGDIWQIDSPWLNSENNGLTYLINKMRGQKIFAHVDLQKSERSKLAGLAADLL